MLDLATDPKLAERQMQALIFALTTFGHIDGDFDDAEREVVKGTIRSLVERRVEGAMRSADASTKRELVDRFVGHFGEIFENVDRFVSEVMTEPVAVNDERDAVVHAKLKLRCFELFSDFDAKGRDALLDAIDELIAADGQVHPAEAKFRAELAQLLASDALTDELLEEEPDDAEEGERVSRLHAIGDPIEAVSGDVSVSPLVDERAEGDHQFFKQLEFHYSANPERIKKQVDADLELVQRAIALLDARREEGRGRLSGAKQVGELEGSHLDGHIQWMRPEPGRVYDVVVLGDLHGCYSALKAGVMQTKFLERVEAYRRDPSKPYPLLVLLGDYIDRGIFSLNGVLRSVLQLFVTAPEHVVPLRGNHEYYIEHQGQMYGGVKPAEAINSLKPYLSIDVFRRYKELFDALPNVFFLGRTMFVHGGIPRERALKQRWSDLASLEDWELRFQMMWSDPSSADVIPAALQDASARFPFGRLQLQAFLQRIGCNVLVRGHEKIEEGFRSHYDGPYKLFTVFSSGGAENNDLPEGSSYRSVQPKGLRVVVHVDGSTDYQPFALDWAAYQDPSANGFFAKPMEIEHRES